MTASNDTPREWIIALAHLPCVTPPRIRLLLQHFEPLSDAATASVELLSSLLNIAEDEARLVKNPLQLPPVARAVAASLSSAIAICDDPYPALLREIADPPLALHFRGDPRLLERKSIAIVGSRDATPYGVEAADRVGRELSALGVTVVSGLARGIDAAAHRGALRASGSTIAVLGTGIDIQYPRGNRALADEIAARGLILSEYPAGTPPRASNFPIRNRLIAGLTLGTVIVEATPRSGSLITARLAAENGREVFAVPGPVFSPRSEGPHRLIQYGAKLLHDIGDVIDELPALNARPVSNASEDERDPLLQMISREQAAHIDLLARQSGLDVSELASRLLELELNGKIRSAGGGRYVKI